MLRDDLMRVGKADFKIKNGRIVPRKPAVYAPNHKLVLGDFLAEQQLSTLNKTD